MKTFLLTIFILAVLAGAYIFLTSEPTKESGLDWLNQAKKAVLSSTEYQAKAKEIYEDYSQLAASGALTASTTEDLKNKLLSVKNLPVDYKDFHLNFIQSLNQLENFLNADSVAGLAAGRELMEKFKAGYGWLKD